MSRLSADKFKHRVERKTLNGGFDKKISNKITFAITVTLNIRSFNKNDKILQGMRLVIDIVPKIYKTIISKSDSGEQTSLY